ncbi:MAG TPA: FtsX-like permease family protein, partial [Thermomicrobiales bacterium]|nr:FtsX-like permease family protein [Thermomicrobiales bacterium]
VDPDTLTTGNYRAVIAEARQLQFTTGPTDTILTGGHNRITLSNDLPRLLNDFALQTNVALTVIALSAVGLLVTGLAALALLAALIADRRRATVALIRGRGASSAQLFAAQIAEGLLLCVPAALLGYGLALLLVDSRPNPWSVAGSLAMAVLTIALLVTASRVNISVALGTLLSRTSVHRGRVSVRRLAAEGAVVLVAVAGIVLLRRRGLAPRVSAEGDVSFDPFLTAVPILLTLAVGLVALRLYPLLMRLAARIAGTGRGLVAFIGLRRVSRQSPVAHLPLLVMLLAIGISIFTAVVRFSISEAQAEGAWQRVGAPYRVETPDSSLPDRLNLGAIEGVTGVAEALLTPTSSGTLLAVEADDLEAMNAGTRADPVFPDSLLEIPGGVALGTERNPLPAVLAGWASDDIRIGSTIPISVPARPSPVQITLRVEEVRPAFAGVSEGQPAVIVNLRALQQAAPDSQIRPNLAFLDGDGLSVEQLELDIAAQTGANDRTAGGVSSYVDVDISSRDETYETIHAAPLSRGVTRSFALSVAMAALYAALAIVTALTLTARARARDMSYLRTLGLSQPQALRLAIIEHVPSVLIASALGAGLGIAIVRLIEPGLDVSAFVGPGTRVPLRTDWTSITAITIALTLITLAAIAFFTAINLRAQISQSLRVGDS